MSEKIPDMLIATRFSFKTDFESLQLIHIEFLRMNSPFYAGEKWAVRQASSVLTKDGEWEFERQPSSRDDAFYSRCRFDSLEDAVAAVLKLRE